MKQTLLSWIFLVVSLLVQAQTTDTTKLIDGLFTQWHNATPGGSIAISRDDKILYNKAFGLADLEHNAPNTTETIFEGGSISKQFTAISILLLAQEGKLSLQDDVRKYIPEFPKYEAPITIQHLLNHTSGLKDWGSIGALAGWPRTTRVYTQELALEIMSKQKSLNFTPGSEYSYSNSNYSSLVTVVERVSKQSLAEFTRTRLFEPMGMINTGWRKNFREVIPHRAIAYSKSAQGFLQNMPFENIYGHGGLLTTTGDLLKWNKVLLTHQIGGDQLGALRLQKGKLNSGKEIKYAAGLFIDDLNGFVEIQHSGATAGYRAWLAYYPQKKLSVVILSNDASFSADGSGRKIAELYLGKKNSGSKEPAFINLTESELVKWQGIYRKIGGFEVFSMKYIDGKIIYDGNTAKTVHAIHGDTLYMEGGLKWIAIKPDNILLQTPFETGNYVRVNPPNLNPAYLKELNGEYYSDEAAVGFSIEVRGDEVWANRMPATHLRLTPAFRDGFLSEDFELYEFKRDQQGKVNGFVVSVSRALRVPFMKTEKKK